MTRGMKGCYVYCCDKALGKYLKSRITSWLAISDDEGNVSFKRLCRTLLRQLPLP